MGMFSMDTLKGDIVCGFTGADATFDIRPERDGLYSLVGECYVHGIMDGEIALLPDLEKRIEHISLV
jgi:hypothetical protein